MAKNLKSGDEVSWHSHGHTVHGKVKKELTSRTKSAGRVVDASEEEPQYRVRSDKTGREAVHKPESLDRD